MQLNGLKLDSKFSDSAQQTWAHARNILLSRGFDELNNESGDTLISTDITTITTGSIVGRIVTPAEIIFFTWNGTKGFIKKMNANGTFTDLITSSAVAGSTLLPFNPSTCLYIEGVHYYNSYGELIIAWTNGVNKPMILNTGSSASPTVTELTDLKQIYLFPHFNHSTIALNKIISGGRLASAAYFLSVTYEIEPDVNINFGIISQPIFITDNDALTAYKQFRGNGSNVITNKAIVATIGNLDFTYNYIKVAVIKRTETSLECYITKRIKITSTNSTIDVLIDDINNLTLFNINEVLISSPAFDTVKTMTQSNKRLRIENLAKTPKQDLHEIYDHILTPRTIGITSVNRTAYTVTVVTSSAHGLLEGATVIMNGWSDSGFNGYFKVTYVNPTTFTYLSSVTASTTPTGGTLKAEILNIEWVTEKQASLYKTTDSYKDTKFIFDTRGFRSDEVYALYFKLNFKTGGKYGTYHIPGREAIGTEASDNAAAIDGVTYLNHKVANTATLLGTVTSGYYGKMGYWQNEDEVYPAEYGASLSGQKVRHHKFPSAGQIHGWNSGYLTYNPEGNIIQTLKLFSHTNFLSTGSTYYGSVDLLTNPTLAVWTAASVAGNNFNKYEALYSHRVTLDLDIDVVVEGTVPYGSTYLKITKYIKTSTGYSSGVVYDSTVITATTSPEMINLLYTGDIDLLTGDYLAIECKIISTETDVAPSFASTSSDTITVYETSLQQAILGLKISLDWNNVTGIKTDLESIIDSWEILYAKRTLENMTMLDQSIALSYSNGYRFYGFDSMVNMLNIQPTHAKADLFVDTADYLAGGFITEVTDYSKEVSTIISKINVIKYLPAYNTATVPTNADKENCYYFETTSGTFDKRLVNFISVKNNLYLDFSNQELISTGIVKPLAQITSFFLYGGDTYIGHNSVLTFGLPTVPRIWYFPVESVLNSGMRYEGDNDYEKFYPLTDITAYNTDTPPIQNYIAAMIAAGVANLYIYNNDFHILNNIKQEGVDNELTSTISSFPNRIYSSMPQPLEAKSSYWRKFKILDYFDMVNNKGAIYKTLGNENIVYIQTDYSIFRGIVVDKLTTGSIDVALKTAEMFDRPLEELLDTDGNYIQGWDREGTILTPYGLVVVDLNKGSIYVISDKATEITKLGIEDWFRNRVKNVMTFNATRDTIGSGVLLGYDDIYKRLLVTLRNVPIPVTSAVRGGTGGTVVTVTTTGNHGLSTGNIIRMLNWNSTVCNGTFSITVTGLTTFTYIAVFSTTGAITGGTLTLNDFTLSFQFEKMQWTAFHDYIPDRYIWNSTGLYTINSFNIHKALSNNNGYYNDVYFPSSVDFIFNGNTSERFLLKSIKWTTNIELNGINYWDETINKLLIYSKNLCTEEITILKKAYDYNVVTYAMEENTGGNAIFRDGEWVFNDIKDYLNTPNSVFLDSNFNLITSALNLSKNYYDKSKIISKFVIIRMSYTNSSSNRKLRISNININVKSIL